MKFFSFLSMILILAYVGFGQRIEVRESTQFELKSLDETESWQYPYKIPDDKRKKFLDVLKNFQDAVEIQDLFGKLGAPDRIDDLSKPSKPLSHFETGFMAGTKEAYSFRCIWFATKASKSPGLSDSWLAAYVDKDQKTVAVVHSNYLQPAGSSGTGRGNEIESGTPGTPIRGETTGVRILSRAKANFTEAACREKFSGKVVVRITFLASGEIGSVEVVEAAPYGLTEQALAAAKRIKFDPAKTNGVPTSVVKLVEYDFDKCTP
jgi:TonB family protein